MEQGRQRASKSQPTVALVGPGAIGTTIAAALHAQGRTPIICGRSPRDQLELQLENQTVVIPGPVLTDPHLLGGTVDLVFLAVKATQIQAAAPWLSALCGENAVVCVLQNGVEQEAMVSPLSRGASVIPSVVWFPAQSQPDGSVLLCGKARLSLPDGLPSRTVSDALRDTWCEVEIVPDFPSVAWRKLLQNAAAGIMALTGRRSGVFGRADIAELSLAYLREGLKVARAEGATLDDDLPQEILKIFQAFPTDMGTSILADREANRPLEWSIRNGVLSRLGQTHAIPTPISDLITTLLAATSDGPG